MSGTPKILLINSVDPTIGPGVLALDAYKAFKTNGYIIDLLTKYPVEDKQEFITVYKQKPSKIKYKIRTKIENIFKMISGAELNPEKGYYFFYSKEDYPQVPINKVINVIDKRYDAVIIMFWQEMLSFSTVKAIYDKLKCQIHFFCVDYSPMSGGCHFTGSCERYKFGCGCCIANHSDDPKDFTSYNVLYRKKCYDTIKPIVHVNSYMKSFFDKSFLLKNYDRKVISYPIIDTDFYKPTRNTTLLREKYNISNDKFVIFFGSQDILDDRKGIKYLLKALFIMYNKLEVEERNNVVLLLAGKNIDPIKDKLYFEYKYLGFVNQEELRDAYCMSNVFLCSSVNDAGPLMVNQSESCGTPIVSFEMGTAIDVVKNRGTGYCAKLRDSEDFANGINYIMHLPKEQYHIMRDKCRVTALEFTCAKAYTDRFLHIYNKYNV